MTHRVEIKGALTVGRRLICTNNPPDRRAGKSGARVRAGPNWMVAKSVGPDPANPQKFLLTAGSGVLVNGANGRTVNLMTETEFGDVKVHLEFCIPKHSDSGVYLMGRYEIQVYDSYGKEKDQYPGIECGGIYP